MNPVKVLKPGSRLICLRDLSNKRLRPLSSSSSSSSSSSFSQSQELTDDTNKRASQLSSSSSLVADAENDEAGTRRRRSEGAGGGAGGGGGGGGVGGGGGGAEGEMRSGCLSAVSKSPVPAATPVGARPLSLRVVASSTVLNGKTRRDFETNEAVDQTAAYGGRSKTASTPSPNSLRQMTAAAAAAAADADAAGEDAASSGRDSPSSSPTKQVGKLKRFLKTIHHLGTDVSVEIGELVRSLVLRLVNGNIGIEEFHAKLHKATNFPLRPFVIPFLKSTLPILQQELNEKADLCRLSPHQYLAKNEHLIFHTDKHNPTTTTSTTSTTISATSTTGNGPSVSLPLHEANSGGAKRLHPDRMNGANCPLPDGNRDDLSPVPKRLRTRTSPPLADHSAESGYVRTEPLPYGLGFTGSRPVLVQDPGGASRVLSGHLERELLQRDRERYLSNYNCHSSTRPSFCPETLDPTDDEWKYVEKLLKCIVGMVDKCQKALAALQERSMRSRDELQVNNGGSGIRRTVVDTLAGQVDIKRYAADLFSNHDFHATEEQRLEAIRNAEETVKTFRRQAVVELQKAMCASEAKAQELLAADRLKMEQTLEEVRRKTHDEITALLSRQEDSDENCWNCGRMASQTCSGCNVARYCGAFCQHRHWENHHRVCGGRTAALVAPSSSSSSSSSALHEVLLPRSTRLLPPPAEYYASGGGGGAMPGLGSGPGLGKDGGHSATAVGASRSRTKSLSPVLLLPTKVKQEAI